MVKWFVSYVYENVSFVAPADSEVLYSFNIITKLDSKIAKKLNKQTYIKDTNRIARSRLQDIQLYILLNLYKIHV